jgi:polysaccharide export outer membrane protein
MCLAVRIIASIVLLAGISGFAQVKRTGSKTQEERPDVAPGGAATKKEAEDAAKAPTNLPVLPTAAPVDPRTYMIGPEDILLVKVWREPELSSAVQVRPDGKITLSLIGEVQASGKTPEQLKETVVDALEEFINKPEVTVSVQSVLSRKFTIVGGVGRNGTFPLVVPITILEALSNAGGFKEFANKKKITILRAGKILKFNYNEVIKGKNMDQNIFVENGDYIVVPE